MDDVYTQLSIDKRVLFERFSGMEALANKYLFSFPSDKNHALLLEAMAAHDYEGVEHCAHALKGISANLELSFFSSICDRIVRTVRVQRTDKACSEDEFSAALSMLMCELSDEQAKITQILSAV